MFLNGGYSPFILTRHKQFQAEVVPQELIVDRTLQQAMASLPFPVIGVPWYQVTTYADLTVLGHEVGHSVEVDLHLTPSLDEAIRDAITDPMRRGQWLLWRAELFADLYGCLCGGPAFVSTLADFLSAEEQANTPAEYPAPSIRFAFNLAVLAGEGHDVTALSETWEAIYPAEGGAVAQEISDVAARMLTVTKAAAAIRFGTESEKSAHELARNVVTKNDQIAGRHDLRVLIAAYRHGFDIALATKGGDLSRLVKFEAPMHGAVDKDLRSGETPRALAASKFDGLGAGWLSQLKR